MVNLHPVLMIKLLVAGPMPHTHTHNFDITGATGREGGKLTSAIKQPFKNKLLREIELLKGGVNVRRKRERG